MDFMNRLNDALDHVEENLCEELDADAFAVAFKRLHGVGPQAARQPDAELKFYARLRFTLADRCEVEILIPVEK